MRKLLSILLICTLLISASSCYFSNGDPEYEKGMVQSGADLLEAWEPTPGRTFSIVIDDAGIYHADINGEDYTINIDDYRDLTPTVFDKANIQDCAGQTLEMVKESKELVIEYINYSEILTDKDVLVEYIRNIPFKMADLNTVNAVEYDPVSNTVFLNTKNPDEVCAYTVTHCLVDVLSQKTVGGAENNIYHGTMFDECMTESITYWLHPETIDDIYLAKYDQFTIWCDFYIGCVGYDGLYAYFYGYDTIFEKIPKTELDVFVRLLRYSDNTHECIIMTNCINDWACDLSEKIAFETQKTENFQSH